MEYFSLSHTKRYSTKFKRNVFILCIKEEEDDEEEKEEEAASEKVKVEVEE